LVQIRIVIPTLVAEAADLTVVVALVVGKILLGFSAIFYNENFKIFGQFMSRS
jgi:hypothetical protein